MLLIVLALQAVATAAPPAPQPRPGEARLRCRRQVETGSLARVRRVCRTAAEWERLYGAGRQQTDALRGPGPAAPGIDGP